MTWCVSALVPASVTSQSTHRGQNLVGMGRDAERDREETPGSEVAPPLVHPRALGDDKGTATGRRGPRAERPRPRRPYVRAS